MMPTLFSMLRSPTIVQASRGSLRKSFWTGHNTSLAPVLARALSSANTLSNTKTPDDPSSAHETLTLLHRATTLLPRALNIQRTSGCARAEESTEFWNAILSSVHEDLLATTERPAKIVVCGLDKWSSTQELVTALLVNPFDNIPPEFDSINKRWDDTTQERVVISYGTELDVRPSSLQLPSPYLTQFGVPIQIIELRLPQSKPLASLPHVLKNLTIFEADVPIIVCNPVATPLSNILASPLPHNTILVLSSRVYEDELDEIIQKHSPHHRPFKCIPVDPKRAVDAIDALESDGEYPHTIARFQRDFIDSNVHVVIHALHDKLESNGSMSALLALRVKTALYHIQDALSGGLTSVRETRQDLNRASIDTNNLRAKIEEAQARVQGDVFGGPLKTDVDQVTAAIRLAEAEMRPVMNRLTWWRMIWRVDEISSIVGHTVIRTWCQALGQKLILHTGHLSALQQSMTESAFTLLSTHQNIPSAVLRNTLLQLKGLPKYPLAPESLSQPLFRRRDQILKYSTMRLHVAGQRAVLVMSGGIATGVGISWAGWLGWLLGSGEGLVGMNAGTAVGVGMLSAVASIRWAVGKWETSKKRWWQDWSRVGEGLDRDLKATLHNTMSQQVTVVAETACNGMADSIQIREKELDGVDKELEELQTCLDDLISRAEGKS